MKERRIERWGKIRAAGKKRYILKYGVLYWGITTAILWSILMYFQQPEENWIVRSISALIIFPIGGIFWGLFTWKINEKKYLSYISDK